MTQQQIQQLFQLRYNQNNWKQFLSQVFSDPRLLSSPDVLTGINTDVATQVLRLGYIALNENGIERNIAIYDVTLAPGIILERNRVGLRNLLRKYWKDIDAAFIVYHRPDTSPGGTVSMSSCSAPNWRFTYVSELTGFDAEGELIKVKTEPKRYTYILGEGESCRTAAERFAIITKKGNKTSLDDVKDAFSVEKLSKSFFDEYKKHYELFCDYMVSKPNIRQTIFNGDEKAIRDFNKKLLGRIVFLYFIQKKGWMGVPENSKWGQGDPDFLWNLFNNARNKDLFYSEYLTRLFFDTLNTPRPNDSIELIKGEKIKIPFLNGGLFEEDNKNYRNLIFPAELFENLFLFFNQYNFTIYEDDPNDHTVAVDPEMLGHIFENLLEDNKDKGAYYTPKEIVHYMCQESLIEYLSTYFDNKGYEVSGYIGFDKPDQPQLFSANEGRKGQMILEIPTQSKDKQIDRLLIEKLLKKKLDAPDTKLAKQHADEFHKALDSVKICDPAIGSGAFPMGLLKEIFMAKQTLYTFEHGNTEGFDASGVKLNIIQNSIYGVDIEKGAVDIARLRFWLSLVVDEEAPKALPNLDYKIVVGNSLVSKLGEDIIDIDWNLNETSHGLFGAELAAEKAELLKKISKKQKEFFNPNSDKKKLAADIRKLKIDLLINQLQLMIDAQNIQSEPKAADYRNKPKAKFVADTSKYFQTLGWKQQIEKLKKLKAKPEEPLNFFDWKLDFPEVLNPILFQDNGDGLSPSKAGFDIVIGNPPYVQLKWLKEDYSNAQYNSFSKSSDIYCLFYEKANELLKIKGVGIYITSNKWLRSDYGKLLKKYLLGNTNNIRIIDFGGYQIFDSATVDTEITFWKRSPNVTNKVLITNSSSLFELRQLKRFNELVVNSNEIWTNKDNAYEDIKRKVETLFKRLSDVHHLQFNYGILTGANPVFILDMNKRNYLINIDTTIDKYIVPILRGKDIEKFWFNFNGYFLLNLHNGVKKQKISPVILYNHNDKHLLEYLDEFGSAFKNRGEKGKEWYNLRSCNYINLYKLPKILYADITQDTGKFYFDDKGYYTNDTAFMIYHPKIEYLKFLTCILNSKMSDFLYKNFYCGGALGNKGIRYKKEFLSKIPVPHFNNVFLALFKNIINLKSQCKDTTALEQQIDNLVYKLYELTYDEVKVIDPGFALTKEEYENIKLE